MSDKSGSKPAGGRGPDFASQMARAELGRHYVDVGRLAQTLKDGEIVLRDKPPSRRGKS
jgi:hypothetical protein